MTKRAALLFLLFAIGCESNPTGVSAALSERGSRIAAADLFTRRYTHSRFSGWNIRAGAAGADCDVLFVQSSIVLDDSMVEAIHYGAGSYGVVNGGVQQFYRDWWFRGVAYKDASERVWTYGDLAAGEGEGLAPCR